MSSIDMPEDEFLFTSESVTEGHPDKMADQISDAVLDAILREDPTARVACETLVNTGLILVSGEITTDTYVDIPRIARETARRIGYTNAEFGFDCNTCSVLTAVDEQSPDIAPRLRALRPAPRRLPPVPRPAPSDLREDGRLRPLRPQRRRLHLGGHRQGRPPAGGRRPAPRPAGGGTRSPGAPRRGAGMILDDGGDATLLVHRGVECEKEAERMSSSARISDLLAEGRCISFEFFPPRTADAEAQLERTLAELAPLSPSFVSFTYGAGGTTRDRTHNLVVDFQRGTGLPAMAHLTCVGHRATELVDLLGSYRAKGVTNILALRGDAPAGLDLPPGDLAHAEDLVELIRGVGGFSIGVAAHPEGHPASPDRDSDRRHLAAKLRRADFAVTQFFFRADDYLAMVDDLDRLGADRPVIPGIMPVTNVRQVQRFAELSGAEIPVELADRLHRVADDPAAVRRVGVAAATELCSQLLDAGAPGLHFYTLNRSQATQEILANLGLGVAVAS